MEQITFGLILESILLGVALAMDAFSVSITDGLAEPSMKKRKLILISGTFAVFQFLMPMIGWICVHTIAEKFELFAKITPFVAVALLFFLGGKMIIEGLPKVANKKGDEAKTENQNSENTIPKAIGIGTLLLQGVATSIDALSLGFEMAELNAFPATLESLIIGVVTFFICAAGIIFGKKLAGKLADTAGIVGGIVLVLIGVKILIECFV